MVNKKYKEMIEDLKKSGKYVKRDKFAGEKVSEYIGKFGKNISKEYPSSKKLKKKVVSKAILKKNNLRVHISDYKAPSVLGDENRFFKGQYEMERRLFFK